MANIKILIQGYAKKLPGGQWDATSTCTLVKSGGKNVLIDPGMFPDNLKMALEKEHLQIHSIDIIVNTHSHRDHTANSRLFDKARVYNPFKEYRKIPDDLTMPGTQIKILYTPGHVDKHIAFLVDTPKGKYAVAGDAIWWQDGEEQKTDYQSLIKHIDPVGKDQKMIQESRKRLFSMADYVIPGHGNMFKVSKQ